VELTVGPFDPSMHVRSRDHYEAIRREAQLIALQPDSPPRRLENLIERLNRQFPPSHVDELVDAAYQAGEASFSARVSVPDELVPAAIAACDELDALLDELDRWAEDPEVRLLDVPDEVRAYRAAYLAQAREQLGRALG
jgi:hypothetical protein